MVAEHELLWAGLATCRRFAWCLFPGVPRKGGGERTFANPVWLGLTGLKVLSEITGC